MLLRSGCYLKESSTRCEHTVTLGNAWDRRFRSSLDLEPEVFVPGRMGCAWTSSVDLSTEKPLSSLSALSFYYRS